MVKKVLAILLFFLLVANGAAYSLMAQEENAFEFESEGLILTDVGTGKVLYAHNEDEQLFPASMTKIMTILLVMEAVEDGKVCFTDEVVISEAAASLGGSQLFLSPGDVVSLEELMVGIAVGSGNDASVAVAEHTAGSLEQFVEKMNERAAELGMKNTHFVNTHGLHDEEHYSSPFDIALVSRELLKHPKVHEWFTIWMDEHFLEGKIKSGEVFLSNTNKLILNYQGADGIKTGFTSEAEHCLAATALRGQSRFIAVIMAAPSSDIRYAEAKKLLDYAFANYESIPITAKGEEVAQVRVDKGKQVLIPVCTGEDFSILVEKGTGSGIETDIQIEKDVQAPIGAGETLGSLIVYQKDKELARADLVSKEEVPRAGYYDLFSRILFQWMRFGK